MAGEKISGAVDLAVVMVVAMEEAITMAIEDPFLNHNQLTTITRSSYQSVWNRS